MARGRSSGASGSKVKSPKKTKSPRRKGTKKAKDPNAPKRAKSAYMFWLAENRARLTKPGMSVVDVTKAAGVEWKKVKDKTKYEKMAAQDKLRYNAEMKKRKEGGGGSGGSSPKKTKK